jgi:hypothetical protein
VTDSEVFAIAEEPADEDVQIVLGMLEEPADHTVLARRRPVRVKGWAVHRDEPISAIQLLIGGDVVASTTASFDRADVAAHHGHPEWVHCGFVFEGLDLSAMPYDGVELAVQVIGKPGTEPRLVHAITFQLSYAIPSIHGSVDVPACDSVHPRNDVHVGGWAVSELDPIERVEVIIDGTPVVSTPVDGVRPDIAALWGAEHAGYDCRLDLSAHDATEVELRVIGHTVAGYHAPVQPPRRLKLR